MKLIQIDNTLYIVEGENKYKVSEESKINLLDAANFIYRNTNFDYPKNFGLDIQQGIDITDIKHRIEMREELNQCDGCKRNIPLTGNVHKDDQTFGIGCTKNRYESIAFLLPEKEDKASFGWYAENPDCNSSVEITFVNTTNQCECKSNEKANLSKIYSIEQIEKAIEEEFKQVEILYDGDMDKLIKAIINNLKIPKNQKINLPDE